MIVYAFYNRFEHAVVAVVSRKDVADRWHDQTPEFHEVRKMDCGKSGIMGHATDDLMEVIDAFLRDVCAGGGD